MKPQWTSGREVFGYGEGHEVFTDGSWRVVPDDGKFVVYWGRDKVTTCDSLAAAVNKIENERRMERRCGGIGIVAYTPAAAGPPEGEMCSGCPDCDQGGPLSEVLPDEDDAQRWDR